MTIPALDPRATIEAQQALAEEATRRQRQLDDLPPTDGDLVAEAHRASVERILGDVRAAERRLAGGVYGTCQRCQARIPVERLEVRPWAAHCTWCAAL